MDIEAYLNMPIKDVITLVPEVGEILDEHEVGCVSCGVGSCLLKDIIEVHNLSEEEEHVVMGRIAKAIYPDTDMKVPKTARKTGTRTNALKYSPPMRLLVDEHLLIKRFIALIPELLKIVDVESSADRQLLLEVVDFIRSYADQFHHAKEEDILFKYFDETQQIIKAMLDDHDKGRAHARGVAEAVERRDRGKVVEHLTAYGELLSHHIMKEDEILYPWMDRNLATTQVGDLFSRFQEADRANGQEIADKYHRLVAHVEETIRTRKESAG
jgi:hemerythrin-like domain-containing protein